MKFTNKSGLPQALFETIVNENKPRNNGDISVTELIDSPRIRTLVKKHTDDISREAENFLDVTFGTAIHEMIENRSKDGIKERRLSIEVHGWKVSGGMDHYLDGTLTDYKSAGVFEVSPKKQGAKDLTRYTRQLNVYAEILRQNDIPINKIFVFIYFKDWKAWEVNKPSNKTFIPFVRAGYPSNKWLYVELPLWSSEEAKRYISERVLAHQKAEKALPLCNKEELWNGVRCGKYCSVSEFCEQFKEQSKTGLIKREDESA